MSKPHKYADAVKGWADGKQIQCRFIGGGWPWEDYVREGVPSFDHTELEWRVKPMTHVRWVNIYQETGSYATRWDADTFAASSRIACLRIEFTEGEGLEDTQGGESGL
jgi:hypothetical protein